jgi:DNA replication protein DnaC
MSAALQIRTALMENLKALHLPAMRECFEQAAQQAEKETLSYEQYLLELSERECESRRRNRIAALLRESGLPREKTMANFDLKRLPVKAGRQLKALVDGSFLDRQENLLLFGNPGAGKSHLLCALAHELIAQGTPDEIHQLRHAGAGSAGSQARPAAEQRDQEAGTP